MNKNELKAKVKEYGYDSLCLRYEKARKGQCEYEKYLARREGNLRKEEHAEDMMKRDCMRFYEILDELLNGDRRDETNK